MTRASPMTKTPALVTIWHDKKLSNSDDTTVRTTLRAHMLMSVKTSNYLPILFNFISRNHEFTVTMYVIFTYESPIPLTGISVTPVIDRSAPALKEFLALIILPFWLLQTLPIEIVLLTIPITRQASVMTIAYWPTITYTNVRKLHLHA